MSTKPASVPTWATDANYPVSGETYSATPTKVAPTGTRRIRGWEPKKKPPAQVENYERNLIGQWCQYLSDGALTGNHSIAGDLSVTGSVDIDTDLNVDGDLDVGGDLLVTGDITVTGDINHGDRYLTFLPVPYAIPNGTFVMTRSLVNSVSKATMSTGADAFVEIHGLRRGDRIKSFHVRGAALGGGTNEPTIYITDQVGDAAENLAHSSAGGIVSTGTVTNTLTDPLTLLSDGEFVTIGFHGNGTSCDFFDVVVVYDHPAAP